MVVAKVVDFVAARVATGLPFEVCSDNVKDILLSNNLIYTPKKYSRHPRVFVISFFQAALIYFSCFR